MSLEQMKSYMQLFSLTGEALEEVSRLTINFAEAVLKGDDAEAARALRSLNEADPNVAHHANIVIDNGVFDFVTN